MKKNLCTHAHPHMQVKQSLMSLSWVVYGCLCLFVLDVFEFLSHWTGYFSTYKNVIRRVYGLLMATREGDVMHSKLSKGITAAQEHKEILQHAFLWAHN